MRREVIAAALVSILAANGCKENRFVPRGRAELILSEIRLRGPEAVSRRLDTDEDFGRQVMDGIASADSAWLEVAAWMRPASATTEASLDIALASALPHAPQRVLALIGTKHSIEEVCGIPFLKADSAAVLTYYDDATRALGTVRDTALVKPVALCRSALDSSRNRRLARIDPAYVIKNKPAPAPRRRRR